MPLISTVLGSISSVLGLVIDSTQSVVNILLAIIKGTLTGAFKLTIKPVANGLDTILKPALNQLFTLLSSATALPVCVYSALPLLFATITFLWVNYDKTSDSLIPNPVDDKVYDFIIAGAGSAGAVIATRLSADRDVDVLLIEAGGTPTILNEIPGAAGYLANMPDNNWNYKSVVQNDSCFGLVDNVMPFARGKALGGTSCLNLMLWVRGNGKDFDNWAELCGDPQWEYDNLLEFFKRSENYQGSFPDDKFHGTGGPVTVSKQMREPTIELWLAAGRELNKPYGDINAYQTEQFTAADVNINEGHRHGTYWAYLEPAMKNSNLHIEKYALASKVLIDSNNVATGVEYIRNGQTVRAFARKEVILSAGTFNSPKLLMLSGVGPADHLNDLGIKVVKDLPGVGDNFHDHVSVYLPFLFDKSFKGSFILERNLTGIEFANYFVRRKGTLTFNMVPGLWFHSTSYNNDPTWPDIEYHMASFGVFPEAPTLLNMFIRLELETAKKWLSPYFSTDGMFVSVQLSKPDSRGTVRLASTDPNDPPIIDPQLLAVEKDVQRTVEAMQTLVNMVETTNTYKAVGAQFIPNPLPGCETFKFKSNEYFTCVLKQFTATMNHEGGTCKMGKPDDRSAVVDPNLKVYNIDRLRVADASIFPVLPNGNTNAVAIMIGEKAACMICKEYNLDCCTADIGI